MRDETEPILIDVPAEGQKLHDEKAALVKRLTEIHREIDAYGYLHPQNHPLRRYRTPGPYLPDEPPELDRSRNGVPDRTLELMFQPIDKIGRPGSGGQTGTPGANGGAADGSEQST